MADSAEDVFQYIRDVERTIVIDHCGSSAGEAEKIMRQLKEAIPGVRVILNPVQLQYPFFQIREEGRSYLRVLGMESPDFFFMTRPQLGRLLDRIHDSSRI